MLRPTRLDHFLDKCVFNPFTGCVLWIGGVSYGGRQSNPYPSFWDGAPSAFSIFVRFTEASIRRSGPK